MVVRDIIVRIAATTGVTMGLAANDVALAATASVTPGDDEGEMLQLHRPKGGMLHSSHVRRGGRRLR